MKQAIRLLICSTVGAALLPGYALAQTSEQLADGYKDTSNVLNYGMGYNLQRFSTLDQINKQTVKALRPVWAYSLEDIQSQESQPLVYNGVIYLSSENATMSVDAKTGRQLWKVSLDFAPETYRTTCCGNNN